LGRGVSLNGNIIPMGKELAHDTCPIGFPLFLSNSPCTLKLSNWCTDGLKKIDQQNKFLEEASPSFGLNTMGHISRFPFTNY
jgi:hypothetical protein